MSVGINTMSVGINITQCPRAVDAELWIAATRALSLHERAYTLSYTLSCTYPCMQKYWNNVLNFAAACVECEGSSGR